MGDYGNCVIKLINGTYLILKDVTWDSIIRGEDYETHENVILPGDNVAYIATNIPADELAQNVDTPESFVEEHQSGGGE